MIYIRFTFYDLYLSICFSWVRPRSSMVRWISQLVYCAIDNSFAQVVLHSAMMTTTTMTTSMMIYSNEINRWSCWFASIHTRKWCRRNRISKRLKKFPICTHCGAYTSTGFDGICRNVHAAAVCMSAPRHETEQKARKWYKVGKNMMDVALFVGCSLKWWRKAQSMDY